MKRAVAYIRKSTYGSDENGLERQEGSYDRQRAAINDYAKRNDLEIVRWYEEPVSGKSIRKRKVFLQLAKDAKLPIKGFDHIIFGEYDRFMRHVKEAMRYEVELDDAGVNLHFTNLKNDGSTADQIYKSVVREMAAEYSRELARKVIQGMYRKAKKGSWLGGVNPYGYQAVKELDGKISLVVFEEQARIIRDMFKLSLEGWGHKRIARRFNLNGIPTSEAARQRNSFRNKNADGKWSGDVIRHMLRNPIYKGQFRWNKRARVDCFDWRIEGQGTVEIGKLRTESNLFRKNYSHGETQENMKFYVDRKKNIGEWVVIDNAIPPIITSELFDRVQERFKQFKIKPWKSRDEYKYLMSGGLRCGSCGNSITGHRYSKVNKESGERVFYYYYRCQGDVKKGTHPASNRPMIKQDAIDDVVIDGINERVNRLIDPAETSRLIKSETENAHSFGTNRLVEINKEIGSMDREMDRIIYAYTKFERSLPESDIAQLKSKKNSLETEKRILLNSEESQRPVDIDKEIEEFLEKIKDAGEAVRCGSSENKIWVREGFLPKAEVSWYTDKPVRVDLYWRRLPEFAPKESQVHLHHLIIQTSKIEPITFKIDSWHRKITIAF